jgi:hypothetical protein
MGSLQKVNCFGRRVCGDADEPIGQNLTRAHSAELLERLAGLKMLAVAYERLKLLERHGQTLELRDGVFHASGCA